jgi:hypothetical protein
VCLLQFYNSQIVSTLANCRRLPATVPDLANQPPQLVFLTPIDSQLNDFLNEIHQIACLEPCIVERIDEDLDLHAKKKKLLRLADAEFLAGQTLDLPKLQLQLRELTMDNIELETGRPRTEAYIVYLFLMLRGFQRRLQRPERPVVAAGVYHAQTLARASGAAIAPGKHPERQPQRGEQLDPSPDSSGAIALYFPRGSGGFSEVLYRQHRGGG